MSPVASAAVEVPRNDERLTFLDARVVTPDGERTPFAVLAGWNSSEEDTGDTTFGREDQEPTD
jgi:hypothetical protein